MRRRRGAPAGQASRPPAAVNLHRIRIGGGPTFGQQPAQRFRDQGSVCRQALLGEIISARDAVSAAQVRAHRQQPSAADQTLDPIIDHVVPFFDSQHGACQARGSRWQHSVGQDHIYPSDHGSIRRCTVSAMQALTHASVLARFGHALADPTRAQIMLALQQGPGYPAELADRLDVSRQSLSNHLQCLRGCGLVVAVPEGRRVRYELADPRLRHALADLLGVVLAVDPAHCAAAEAGQGCC